MSQQCRGREPSWLHTAINHGNLAIVQRRIEHRTGNICARDMVRLQQRRKHSVSNYDYRHGQCRLQLQDAAKIDCAPNAGHGTSLQHPATVPISYRRRTPSAQRVSHLPRPRPSQIQTLRRSHSPRRILLQIRRHRLPRHHRQSLRPERILQQRRRRLH